MKACVKRADLSRTNQVQCKSVSSYECNGKRRSSGDENDVQSDGYHRDQDVYEASLLIVPVELSTMIRTR